MKPAKVHTIKSTPEIYGDDVMDLLLKEQEGPQTTALFRHQVDATVEVTRMARKSNILLKAPTGSGKTGIMALLIYARKAHRTMILTPTPTLSKQMKDAIGRPFKEESFWGKSKFFDPDVSQDERDKILPNVQVVETTAQLKNLEESDITVVNAHKFGANSSYSIRKLNEGKHVHAWLKDSIAKIFSSFDLLIVDEAHHFPAPIWNDIVTEFNERRKDGRIIFVTATPYRRGPGGKLKSILSSEVNFETYVISEAELTKNVIRPLQFLEREDASNEEDDHLYLVEDVFSALEFQKSEEDRFKHQCLIITESRKVAKELGEIFNRYKECPNDAVAIVDGHYKTKKEIERFKKGECRVGIVCRMLCEGFDLSNISVVVIYRRVMSQILFEQYVGRCLRKHQFPGGDSNTNIDKTEALVMSYERFGQQKLFDNLDKFVADDYVDANIENEEEE